MSSFRTSPSRRPPHCVSTTSSRKRAGRPLRDYGSRKSVDVLDNVSRSFSRELPFEAALRKGDACRSAEKWFIGGASAGRFPRLVARRHRPRALFAPRRQRARIAARGNTASWRRARVGLLIGPMGEPVRLRHFMAHPKRAIFLRDGQEMRKKPARSAVK